VKNVRAVAVAVVDVALAAVVVAAAVAVNATKIPWRISQGPGFPGLLVFRRGGGKELKSVK
jgi:hypothetical protein